MAPVKVPSTYRHDERGWVFPLLMLTAVVVLLVVLIVLVVRGSSVAPSTQSVESQMLQLWKTVESPTNVGADFATCDYNADQWSVGYSFQCSIWDAGTSVGDAQGLITSATFTVQTPPPYNNGQYASVLFGDGTGPYLVHF